MLATKGVVDATPAGAWNSGHPGPRPSGARYARVHLRSCSDVANMGQEIQPEAAKRTVVQTETLDTEGNRHANQQVKFEKERTGEISGLNHFPVFDGEILVDQLSTEAFGRRIHDQHTKACELCEHAAPFAHEILRHH